MSDFINWALRNLLEVNLSPYAGGLQSFLVTVKDTDVLIPDSKVWQTIITYSQTVSPNLNANLKSQVRKAFEYKDFTD